MHDVPIVQVADPKDDLSYVEASLVFAKLFFTIQKWLQLPTCEVWQNKVDPALGLKDIFDSAEEWVVDNLHHISFIPQ